MPLKPCIDCGTLSPNARCPTHTTGNTSWNGTRDRAEQRRFRNTVLEHAGYRCQATEHGQRCTVTNVSDLQAHHLDPRTGVALCRAHHRAVDKHAR